MNFDGLLKPKLRLYHYWRSTSSWRVRWGLTLKRVPCEYVAVSLLDGESESPEHQARNPLGFVPVLERLDVAPEAPASARYLSESLAILQFLDEVYPQPPLLPSDPWERAHCLRLAELINAGIQPLQNLSVTEKIAPGNADAARAWNQFWIERGLVALETWVAPTAGAFCLGDRVSLADLCLIPQLYAAERNQVDLSRFPTLVRIRDHALATESCKQAHPDAFAPPAAPPPPPVATA